MRLSFYNFLKLILLSCLFSYANAIAKSDNNAAVKLYYGNIPTLVLSGSLRQMGVQYGASLRAQLKQELFILEDYYIDQQHLTYSQLVTQASLLYNRFPERYQVFMQGMAQGSALSLNEVKILNAMETLGELLPDKPQEACAFLFMPQQQTTTGGAFIGRNYDYAPPFDQLAKYLTVTVLKEPHKVATAFISIAGEIYCPSCINAAGIFLELNNGMPSGGTMVNHNTTSMLAVMLDTLRNSNSLTKVQNKLNHKNSDYSLIVNAANATADLSFEYSTNPILGMHYYVPDAQQNFVSTNFFLDSSWGDNVPVATDANSWYGVTRRNNLLNLSAAATKFNLTDFKALMSTSINSGGAVWDATIYQIIFDAATMNLYIRILSNPNTWEQIPLGEIFKQSESQ
ncbi:MAG: C45 family autoproteolytic acyltransferase/hydrolase [Burkholderiales bacterium]|nr:C45 family autoproteolytic acyltransferase/hydrolase [Burkholderiales bacterium]